MSESPRSTFYILDPPTESLNLAITEVHPARAILKTPRSNPPIHIKLVSGAFHQGIHAIAHLLDGAFERVEWGHVLEQLIVREEGALSRKEGVFGGDGKKASTYLLQLRVNLSRLQDLFFGGWNRHLMNN